MVMDAEISSNIRLPTSSLFDVCLLPPTTMLPLKRCVVCYTLSLALSTVMHLDDLNDGGAHDRFGRVGQLFSPWWIMWWLRPLW